MAMQGLLGILLLIAVANVVAAIDEITESKLEAEDCEDCDDELDENDTLANEDELSAEERKRPPKKAFCERTKRAGWGGKCSEFTLELLDYRCDFFWNNTNNPHRTDLCYNDNQACCVDCKSPKQRETCWKKRNFSISRGYCCDNELQVCKPLSSGCVCCKHCKRKRGCRHPGTGHKGYCVTEFDPKYNTTSCLDQGGKLKKRACMGIGCFCCVLPAPYTTYKPDDE